MSSDPLTMLLVLAACDLENQRLGIVSKERPGSQELPIYQELAKRGLMDYVTSRSSRPDDPFFRVSRRGAAELVRLSDLLADRNPAS